MNNQDRSTHDFGENPMLRTTASGDVYHEDYDPFHRDEEYNPLYPERSDAAWAENQQLYQDIIGIAPTPRYSWHPEIVPYNTRVVIDEISIDTDDTTTTCDSTIADSIVDSILPPTLIETTSNNVIHNSNTMYHNPHFLGTLDYYYPPRFQQVTSSQTMLPTDESPTLLEETTLPQESNVDNGDSIDAPNQHSCRFHQQQLDTTSWDNFQSSCSTLKANDPWGDDYSVKYSNSFRIYFQNINSLGLSNGPDKATNIMTSMIQSECDIINWVQTSLNWKLLRNRNMLHDIIRNKQQIYKLNVGRNKYISPSVVIPGGTAQLIRGNWTGRVVEMLHDFRNLGRWCGVKLRLKHGRFLYVINAYRVCDQSMSQIGPETAFGQQAAFLHMDDISVNPRKQFILDLIKCVKEWQQDKDEVLILMDANEDLQSAKSGLVSLMRECKLIDIFHHHHGISPNFGTFDKGQKRLDYAIGSASLLPFVLKCGYLPFYLGVSSDHRGLFLDMSMELIDGLTHLEAVPRRHLNSSFPKDVFKYKQYIHKEFLSHNIYRKAEDLYSMAGMIKAEDPIYVQKLIDMDALILNIQLKGEEECCRKRTPFDFSEEIHYTKIIMNYWNIRRKEFTRNRSVTGVSKIIYDQLPESYQQFIDIATGKPYTNWLNTKKRLRIMMVELKKSRATEKRDLDSNEALYKGITVDKVVQNKTRLKQESKLYQTLRSHFHPNERSGLSYILVPDADKEGAPTTDVDKAVTWRTETSPQAILDTIRDRNIQHFGQADGTPFTNDPILSNMGYNGMSSSGIDLVESGTLPYYTDSVSVPTQDVFNRLGDTTRKTPPDNDHLSIESFTKAIKKWRESTSTSPSGKHLGHYKSLLAIDSHSSTYTEDNPDPGPTALQVLYHIATAAFRSGLTLPRWQNITTCMIEKIPGTPRINKIRVIHLYEADYNAINKIVWQRGAVWDAHLHDRLNKAQAGSRPAHTCIEVVMSKELKYLISHLTRTPMATMDNDAKSCYDRVIASLALIISHHFGVPEHVCKTVGDTLCKMKFKIRTAMGISEQEYSHSMETPIHGVGQGGTASPAFWLLISSILFDCYEKRAKGMTLTDPTGIHTVKQWLEAIVDDTSLFTNIPGNSDVAMLIRTLEADAQYWENLLSVSGGCLELSKCFYYVLAWTFTDKGDPIPLTTEEINDIAEPIQLREFGKLSMTSIQMKSVDEAHKTLGVWKTMIGDDSSHLKHLQNRSNNMASIVATSGMFPHQADIALRNIYTPSMLYSLPSVNVTEKELNRIQNKALESFVPTLGYNRTFPHAVLFGPSDYGGAAIPHLHTESNIQKLDLMIMHIRAKTELGTLFRIALNYIQLLVGFGTPFFEHSHPIPYMSNWFTEVRDFLISINGTLCIKDTYVPQLERQHDQFLMEAFSNMTPSLSKNQLRYMYNWRVFFKIEVLSDITNPQGDSILPIYLTYPGDNTRDMLRDDKRTTIQWPYQECPESKTTFALWVSCLRKCFSNRSGFKLRQSLGNWTVTPQDSRSIWTSYYDSVTQSLYRCDIGTIHKYSTIIRATTCTTTFDGSITELLSELPSTCFPITTTTSELNITAIHNKIQLQVSTIPSVTVTTIDDAIQQAPSWQYHLLRNYRIHDVDDLIRSIENPETHLLSVTDGGNRDGTGSFGVSMGTPTHEIYSIEGPAPGNTELMTSFRSESYGMLAGLNFICLFIQVYQVRIPKDRIISVYCDNLTLVNWINRLLTDKVIPRMFLKSESDVIMQIVHEISQLYDLGITLQILHVKGHQDDKTPYNELSRPSQLNVDADSYATNFLNQGKSIPYQELPANPVNLYILKLLISRSQKHEIRKASCSQDFRIYMVIRLKWHNNTPDLVWWEIHGSSMRSLHPNDRRRIRKFIFRWLPTCQRLKKFEPEDNVDFSDKCPSCGTHVETHAHILKCTCNSRDIIKTLWLAKVKLFLYNTDFTPDFMGKILYNVVESLCTSVVQLPLPGPLPSLIESACHDQHLIGWDQIMCGRLAHKWGTIIANHLYKHKVDPIVMSALMWGRKFVKLMFEVTLHLWQQRNMDGHIVTTQHDSPLARDRLLATIESMQRRNPDISYGDRVFVHRPIETLQTYSLLSLQAWHRMAKNIIQNNVKRNNGLRHTPRNARIRSNCTNISANPPVL